MKRIWIVVVLGWMVSMARVAAEESSTIQVLTLKPATCSSLRIEFSYCFLHEPVKQS